MTSSRNRRSGTGSQFRTWGVLLLLATGCAHGSHAQSGALMGTGFGALTGAAIGSHHGNAGAGAVLGGVTGAIAGGILGDAQDARVERDLALMERDAAVAQAQYLAQSQPRLTNFDLMRLSQSRVGDDVIINMIRSRGGEFDLSPDSVIALKSSGVSDAVILAAQQQPVSPNPVPVAPPGVVVMPQPAVVVEPAPLIVSHPWHFHGRHHHRRPRSGASFHFNF